MEEILLEGLEDSRQGWKVEHSLGEILTVVMCGVSAGERSIHGICAFARIKEEWLRREVGLALPNGLPSYDTVRRVMGALSPKQFHAAFIRWMEAELELPRGGYVSLDGKSLRGSARGDVPALHLLGAYSHELGVVLGQRECSGDKGNEITERPKLLGSLRIRGCVVTADAMMCQKDVARELRSGRNDYVLALKDNHPLASGEVSRLFADAPRPSWSRTETLDKGHGRLERRTYTLDTDVAWFQDRRAWRGLAAFGQCESVVTRGGRTTRETRRFLTSLTDVGEFARAVRSHWAIENTFRWSLDVIFGDDACAVVERNTAENLAIMRRIVYNRIKMATGGVEPLSLGRRKCIYDDAFRKQILFSC
jgi:predicted transposase YbfD/YdcC